MTEMERSTKISLFVMTIVLALMPITPEPHLFGKIRWVMGGAEGMQLMDWLDLMMHGLPFTVVGLWLLTDLLKGRKKAA